MEQLLLPGLKKEDFLEEEIKRLRAQCERVRKGQFAEIGHLKKLYWETKNELDDLKIAICRGNK